MLISFLVLVLVLVLIVHVRVLAHTRTNVRQNNSLGLGLGFEHPSLHYNELRPRPKNFTFGASPGIYDFRPMT